MEMLIRGSPWAGAAPRGRSMRATFLCARTEEEGGRLWWLCCEAREGGGSDWGGAGCRGERGSLFIAAVRRFGRPERCTHGACAPAMAVRPSKSGSGAVGGDPSSSSVAVAREQAVPVTAVLRGGRRLAVALWR
jgi:hypothetical protein